MKKFFFIACAALAFTACTDVTEQVAVVSQSPITVDVYTQSLTRTDINTLKQENFSLRIYTTQGGAASIDETVTVSYDATKDAYEMSKVVYWPLDKTQVVNFVAYYGAQADGTVLSVDGTTDVVIAETSSSLNSSASGKVSLSFSHILSQVSISTDLDNSNFTYSMTSFTLTGAKLDRYDMATKTWSASDNNLNTTLSTGTNMYAVPQAYEISAEYVVTSQDGSTQNLNRSGNVTFAEGNAYNIKVILPAEATQITVSVNQVDNWTPGTPEEIQL